MWFTRRRRLAQHGHCRVMILAGRKRRVRELHGAVAKPFTVRSPSVNVPAISMLDMRDFLSRRRIDTFRLSAHNGYNPHGLFEQRTVKVDLVI